MANQFQVSIDDFGNWVFIDRSDFDLDSENDSVFEVESLDLVESIDSLSFSSDEDKEEKDDPINDIHDIHAHDDDDDDAHVHDGVNCNRVIDFGHQFENSHLSHVYDNDVGHHDDDHDHGHDDDEEEDDDDDDGYDVDDELVPWDVKDRFERQRIRKLGKRAFAKMTKSKKSVLLYTKPGCVRGKHGLGLKAY